MRAPDERIVDPPKIVLKPKLRAPVPRPEQLVRRGLLELLHDSLDCRVSVVSAPTGYGKTTLLAHWLQVEEADMPFAWVSLDEQDDDPIRLWRHIVEALRRVAPEEDFGADLLVGMNAAGRGFVEITLPTLINEVAELPYRIALVLDDYQYVSAGDAHKSVAFFMEHLPENVHLIISSRSDPPLPLGRLRAMGELAEIRTGQLAFTEEEVDRLLNEKMGLGVGPEDLTVLHQRTEGWPAGIYLASLSLQNKEDKHAFIETFGGSNQYIVGLLGEEVLAGLAEEVRRFLLETSVLRRLTGPLCDAVTGRRDSATLLRELASSNLFVVALDDQDEWYRYHHLFSEHLLYELRSTDPYLAPTLRGRASAWLEREGYVEGAIRQAVEAEDFERVGLLISRHWYEYFTAGRISTVERWLGSLPEGTISYDAPLALVRAWLGALGGRPKESARYLSLAEGIPHQGPLPDGTISVESGAAVLRASFAYSGVRSGLEAARLAAKMEPGIDSPWAPVVRFALGTGLYLCGETSQARKPLREAIELTTVEDQPMLAIIVQSWLSIVTADEGHTEEAGSWARSASALAERYGLSHVPQVTQVSFAYGRVLAAWGHLEEAQKELEDGLAARRKLPGLSPWPTLIGLLALAQTQTARGDRSGARKTLAEARTIVEDNPDAGIFPELLERQEQKLRARRPRSGHLDEELTERELDVLGLLPGVLTSRQMAESLYVAPSTIRSQIKSIYRKLGVSSRAEAVEEARARKLI